MGPLRASTGLLALADLVPLYVIGGMIAAFTLGYLSRKIFAARDAQSAETRAQKLVLEAERDAEAIAARMRQETREEIAEMRRRAEEDARLRREEAVRQERRIS